eukprot:gene27071-33741_t
MVTTDTKPRDVVTNLKLEGINTGYKTLNPEHVNYNHTPAGYHKARRFISEVNADRIDPFDEGFSFLPPYIDVVKDQNPGSCFTLHTKTVINPDGSESKQFVRLFAMLKQQAVCASYCKPVMSLDGGFMKTTLWGKYQVLATAVSDGEGRDVVVSLALVPVENKVNYEWVMDGHNSIPEMEEFTNQIGLVVTTDRFCNRHLMGNIPGGKAHFGKKCQDLYWQAVRAPTEVEFEEIMEELKVLHPIGYDYLMNVSNLPRCMWTDHAFPMRTWGLRTNNPAEHTMHWMGDCMRAKSAKAFLEEALVKIMEVRGRYLAEALAKQAKGDILSDYAFDLLLKNIAKAEALFVNRQSGDTLYINRESKSGTAKGVNTQHVDLSQPKPQCTCRPCEEIPCEHIICALDYVKRKGEILHHDHIHKGPNHLQTRILSLAIASISQYHVQ